MRATKGSPYRQDAKDLRDRMDAASISNSPVRQRIMDAVLEVCRREKESPALCAAGWCYVDTALTEFARSGNTYRVTLYARPWTDKPAFLLETLTIVIDAECGNIRNLPKEEN